MPPRNWIAAAGLVAVVAGASLWYGRSSPEPLPLELGVAQSEETGTITVHVAGEVRSPGLVMVGSDARVADAIAAAGGSTRDAELARINLAAPLRDGEQIVIPGATSAALSIGAVGADGRVHINSATVAELEELPGVGPVLADRIAAYRDEHGSFATVEDLLDVPGIGEGKLATLRDSVALP